MLKSNVKETAFFVTGALFLSVLCGASQLSALVVMAFTLTAYFKYAVRIDKLLLDSRTGATGDILGAQIGFAFQFGAVITACAIFGDQYTAFFGGIVLWHIYMIQSDRLSQKLLKGNKK